MKKFRKLIPALALLLVSAVLMSTASYAWFSMNNKVTVTGMEVKTKVSNNLLISTTTSEESFKTSIAQSVKGILEPSSTVDGVDYFYTTADNVTATGAVSSTAYFEYATTGVSSGATGYTDKFSEANGITTSSANTLMTGENKAKAYVDYSFYLKVTNTEGEDKDVRLTSMNLLYGNQALSSSATIGSSAPVNSLAGKAWRTAIFVKQSGTNTCTETTDEVATGNLVSILALEGATYFVGSSAVDSVSTRDTVSELGTAATICQAPAGNSYWKVTIRLWLEGEDSSCNNTTFATLDQLYSLDLTIEFNNGTSATHITSVVPTP